MKCQLCNKQTKVLSEKKVRYWVNWCGEEFNSSIEKINICIKCSKKYSNIDFIDIKI